MGPSAKFPTVGTVHKGIVLSSRVADQTDMNGEVKTFKDGSPRKELRIAIQTDERDPSIPDDDGVRVLYASGGKKSMLDAIREATKPHGGLREGGILAVKYTGDGVPAQRGWNAPKEYAAQYTPPATPVPSFGDDSDDAPF